MHIEFEGIRYDTKGFPFACSYVDGHFASTPRDSANFPVVNPATGQAIGQAYGELPFSVRDIKESARIAQTTWFHDVPEKEKERVFDAMKAKFEEHRGPLIHTMILEGGKLWRWADAEVTEAVETVTHYHGEHSRYETKDGLRRAQTKGRITGSIRKPWGTVLGITPWNFPLAVPLWKICGSLAGGNAIVVKDAEQTPFTLTIAIELIQRAIREVIRDSNRQKKLAGLVQLIHGYGIIGGRLVQNLDYDKVAFTGSVETGKWIAGESGKQLKPCHLELGGHAAIVVLDDFNLKRAAAEIVNACFGDSGQRCVSARVVFVQESVADQLIPLVIEMAKVRTLCMGDPRNFQTEMGPLISKEQLMHVHDQVIATEGVIRDLGGYDAPQIGGAIHPLSQKTGGYYYPPTIFLDVPYGITAMDEEIFGPVLVINRLPGKTRREAFDNAILCVNQSAYGLSNALLTNDLALAMQSPWFFESGIFYIRRGTTGAELNTYFGGVKKSGWGREGRGLDAWTQTMQVTIDTNEEMSMAQAGDDEATRRLIESTRSPLN